MTPFGIIPDRLEQTPQQIFPDGVVKGAGGKGGKDTKKRVAGDEVQEERSKKWKLSYRSAVDSADGADEDRIEREASATLEDGYRADEEQDAEKKDKKRKKLKENDEVDEEEPENKKSGEDEDEEVQKGYGPWSKDFIGMAFTPFTRGG